MKIKVISLGMFLVSCSEPTVTKRDVPKSAPETKPAQSAQTAKSEPTSEPKKERPCVDFTQEERANFQRDVQSRYKASGEGYTLGVTLKTCEVDPDEIFFESGFGHSSRIFLYKLSRSGGDVTVSQLELQGFGFIAPPKSLKGFHGEHPYPVELKRATIPEAKLKEIWTEARLAVGAELTEIEPPPKPSSDGTFSLTLTGSGSSSSDFSMRVVVGKKERAFAGYEGGSSQLKYLPMQGVVTRLKSIVEAETLTVAPIDQEAKDLFRSQFMANQAHASDSYYWWVQETYLSSFGAINEPSMLPLLQPYLMLNVVGGSEERLRYQAINAAATMTGKELRYDASGVERPAVEVAAEYVGLLMK